MNPVPSFEVLKSLPSGDITIEKGGDGVYLRFNCDCLDTLHYCKARCCALPGTELTLEETLSSKYQYASGDAIEIARRADGYCVYNDPTTCQCTIYEDRPNVCQTFHCTKGIGMRGWRLQLVRFDPNDP